MNSKPAIVKIIKTGKEVAVKSWGHVFIDAAGNYYTKQQIEFVRVLE
jgi:hypothetical protein